MAKTKSPAELVLEAFGETPESIRQPYRMMAAHRSTDPLATENVRERDLPLEANPLNNPIELLISGLTAGPARKLVEPLANRAGNAVASRTASRALPWLAKSAVQNASMGGTMAAVAPLAEGRNPLPDAAAGAIGGAIVGPPVEAGLGAGLAGLRGLVRPRAKAPTPSLAPTAALPAQAAPTAALEPTQTRVGPSTGATVPQVAKLEKVGLPDPSPELAHVERTLASLGMGTRKVRTFDDMRAAAQELGMDPRQLLSGAAARPISDAEVVATANLINDAATMHEQAIVGLNNAALTEPERIALQQQAAGALKAIEEALKRRIKGGTESGRAVAAFRIIGNRTMDPAYWYTLAQRQLGEKPFTPEIKAAIDQAIGAGDRVGLARTVAGLHQSGWADKFTTLLKAMMLSNPGTDVRNVGGNTVFNAALSVADLPAASIDMLISRATGFRSKMGPSLTQLAEAGRGVGAGVRKAGEVLRHGDTAENVLAKYDFNRDVHFDNPVLEFFTQAVFRRLGAEDYLFREPARFRAIAELAEVTAKNEGLRGAAFLDRVRQLVKTPTPKMVQAAEAEAAYRTFNQPSAFANWLGGVERAGTAGKLIGTTVVPFKRTPINVANAVVDFSPFGIPKSVLRYIGSAKGADPLLRQRYLVEGLGRSLTGTALAGLGWSLAQQGLAVGGPPSKADEKNLRRALQVPNYAVRIGDNWVSINNNAPMSNVFMMGVDAAEQFRADKGLADKVLGSTFAMTKGLTEQTFLKGVKGASEAATDPGRFGGTWLEGVAGMVVPSLVGAVARGTDPLERRINSPGDAIAARVPGLRQTLEPQVDAYGQDRRQQTGLAGQLFAPVRISPARQGRLAQALLRSGYAPDVPQARELKLGKLQQKLTEQQLTKYQRAVGAAQSDAMLAVVELTEGFSSLDAEEQANRLRRAAEDAERRVRNQWKTSVLVMGEDEPNSGSLVAVPPNGNARTN